MLNLFEVACLHRSESDSCVGPKACAMFLALWTPSSDLRGATSLRRATTRWHCESTRGRWTLYIPSSWSSRRHFFVRPQPRETFCRLSSFDYTCWKKRFVRAYFLWLLLSSLTGTKIDFWFAWRGGWIHVKPELGLHSDWRRQDVVVWPPVTSTRLVLDSITCISGTALRAAWLHTRLTMRVSSCPSRPWSP